MKIVPKNPESFRVYHHPFYVVIHSNIKTVEILDNGELVESFNLIEKNVEW